MHTSSTDSCTDPPGWRPAATRPARLRAPAQVGRDRAAVRLHPPEPGVAPDAQQPAYAPAARSRVAAGRNGAAGVVVVYADPLTPEWLTADGAGVPLARQHLVVPGLGDAVPDPIVRPVPSGLVLRGNDACRSYRGGPLPLRLHRLGARAGRRVPSPTRAVGRLAGHPLTAHFPYVGDSGFEPLTSTV